jgi:hypothetical protein
MVDDQWSKRPAGYTAAPTPSRRRLVLFGFAAVITHFNAMNLYGATLTAATMAQTFRSD